MTTPVQTKCSIHVTTRIYIFIISHIKSVQTSQMLATAKDKATNINLCLVFDMKN